MNEKSSFSSIAHLSNIENEKSWSPSAVRPLPRRRRGYGRNAQRSVSTSSLTSEFSKRKKRALRERQYTFEYSCKGDSASMGSLESTEYSGSSLSSFDLVKTRSGSRELNRRVLSDLDKSSRHMRRVASSSLFQESLSDYDLENFHPNVNINGGKEHLPPSKVKKRRPAPFYRQKFHDNEVSIDCMDFPLSPEKLRKTNVVRSKSLTMDILDSPEPNRPLPLKRATSLKHQSGRHSPAFSNASSISSFSSLAKTGSLGPCWVSKSLEKASKSISNKDNICSFDPPFSDYDTADTSTTACTNSDVISSLQSQSINGRDHISGIQQNPSTPERKQKFETADSLRKRGVCDSPTISLEDMNFSIPPSRRLSQVCNTSASRSRSRSRLFTQNNDDDDFIDSSSVFKRRDSVNSSSYLESKQQIRSVSSKESECDDDSCMGERDFMSDDETKQISASSSGELSFTIPNDQTSELNQKQRNKPPDDINGSLFASKIGQMISPRGQQEMAKINIDAKKIPSYLDLKYIVQSLRKVHSSKSIAGFGSSRTWTVVTPQIWSPSRKATFLQWATTGLGFCLRPAGGGISYLLTTCDRGSEILEHLEKALNKLKLGNESARKHTTSGVKSSKQKNSIPSDLRFKTDSENKKVKNERNIPSFFPVTSSSIKRSTRKKRSPSVNVRVSPLDRNIEVELLNSLDNLDLNYEEEDDSIESSPPQSETQESSTPLVRMITLEDEKNANPSFKSSRFSSSPKESSFEIHRLARSSGEYVPGSQELLMHCHGISPPFGIDRQRPSRLKITNSFIAKCQPDTISPHTINSEKSETILVPNHTQINSVLSHETIETPMPTGCVRHWGSRPIPGKDWGLSNQCDQSVISILSKRFQELFAEYKDQVEESNLLQTYQIDGTIHQCYVDPNILAIAASTEDLGFDREADNSGEDCSFLKSSSGYANEKWDGRQRIDKNECNIHQHVFCSDSFHRKAHENKRRTKSLAKHKRVSLCASFLDTTHGQTLFEEIHFFPPETCDKAEASAQTSSFVSAFNCTQICSPFFPRMHVDPSPIKHSRSISRSVIHECVMNHTILCKIFSFLGETSLFCQISLVCSKWANAATSALANLALVSLGCEESDEFSDDESLLEETMQKVDLSFKRRTMEKSWSWLIQKYPMGSFLSEGSFKQVFRVWNSDADGEEAISVMDIKFIDSTGNKHVIGAELSTSILLSSLARRSICPNFVIIRGLFICAHQPPIALWSDTRNVHNRSKNHPKSSSEDYLEEPSSSPGKMYQYIRMELCKFGDVESFIRNQSGKVLNPIEARMLLFQMAFALHTAGDRFGLKHYDVKLLNFLLQSANHNREHETTSRYTTLRYGIGAHVFALRLPSSRAYIAKLADYGTSKMQTESDGQPITLAQFTTLENTPPEFMIHGDHASQGYGHDCFGLGLCMLHLFTGHGPYEEILDEIVCPLVLRKKLRKIWESEELNGYEVVKSVIMGDVYEDENGEIEGSPDEILYHTLYRYLVLFGIPKDKLRGNKHGKIWRAIVTSLTSKKIGSSCALQYQADCKKFSFSQGNDSRIITARKNLQSIEGGVDVLMGLTSFEPDKRWSPLDVINSTFMEPLREVPQGISLYPNDIVHSFMAYKTPTILS